MYTQFTVSKTFSVNVIVIVNQPATIQYVNLSKHHKIEKTEINFYIEV